MRNFSPAKKKILSGMQEKVIKTLIELESTKESIFLVYVKATL